MSSRSVGLPFPGAGVGEVDPVVVELVLQVVHPVDDQVLLLLGRQRHAESGEGDFRLEGQVMVVARPDTDVPQQRRQGTPAGGGGIVDQPHEKGHHVGADLPAGALVDDHVPQPAQRDVTNTAVGRTQCFEVLRDILGRPVGAMQVCPRHIA